MRTVDPQIYQIFQDPLVESFILVSLGDPTEPVKLLYTSLPYDFDYQGHTYLANNGLISISPPVLSKLSDREPFKLTFSDTQGLLESFLKGYSSNNTASKDNTKVAGVPVVVTGGFINVSDFVEAGTDPDQPYSVFMNIYSGRLDRTVYGVSEDGEAVLTLECSSPMSALDLTMLVKVSKEYMNRLDPLDTSYDSVLESSADITLNWGRV